MSKISLYTICALSIIISACASSKIFHNELAFNIEPKALIFPEYEQLQGLDKAKADSIIAVALDHEAMYSLLGDLKPISSVGMSLSYPLGKDSLNKDGDFDVVAVDQDSIKHNLEELKSWNRVLKALSSERYRFIVVPFSNVWDGDRYLQILVCRTDLIDSLLIEKAPFFAQWGHVPGTDPAVLLTSTEYESRNDRYRAYGYLFGYPDHAVDFFVEASIEQENTGSFVKRSFFHIPVHNSETGYFTYALPEDFKPLPSDSSRYLEAIQLLERYREKRTSYINSNGQLNGIQLIRDWNKEPIQNKLNKD